MKTRCCCSKRYLLVFSILLVSVGSIFMSVSLSSCSSPSVKNPLLLCADSLMETCPDSALSILESITCPQNMVAAGVADEMLVQVSYAIGVARPINIFVDTYGRSHVNMTDGEIARVIDQLFDLRPKAIEERLKLRNPIYQETAAYGHMGREPQVITKKFFSRYEGDKTVEVELFTWEKLDYVDKIKAAFGL